MSIKNQQENTESAKLVGTQQIIKQKPSNKGLILSLAAGGLIWVLGLGTAFHSSNNYSNKAKELIEKTPELKKSYALEKEMAMALSNLPDCDYLGGPRVYIPNKGESLLRKVFESPSSENFYRNLIKEYDSFVSQERVQELRQMVVDYEMKGAHRGMLGMLALPVGCLPLFAYAGYLRLLSHKKSQKLL